MVKAAVKVVKAKVTQEAAKEKPRPEVNKDIWHVIVPLWPNDSELIGHWLARKFIPGVEKAVVIQAVPGVTLPTEGVLDLREANGALLAQQIAQTIGQESDPVIQKFLEVVNSVFRREPQPCFSLHDTITSLRYRGSARNDPSWRDPLFDLLDCLYDQEDAKEMARQNMWMMSKWETLPNGLKVVNLRNRANLRGAALEEGADVVVWCIRDENGRQNVGIQTNLRRHHKIDLTSLYEALVEAENTTRGKGQPPHKWFLSGDAGSIYYGTKRHLLREGEATCLSPLDVWDIIVRELSKISPEDN